jgi:flap endonuclease-1
MGVNLSDILPREKKTLEDYRNHVIAIDAYNTIYQFISSIRRPDGTPLLDFQGHPVSHLKGLLTRTANLVAVGIKPVYVFDGKPHELKLETIELRRELKQRAMEEWQEALEAGDLERARTKAQQTGQITADIIEESKHLLKCMGIPYVEAPSEGEAQASYMAQRGDVTATSSQDFDSLLFGAPELIRNLAVTGRRKLPRQRQWVNIEPESIHLDRVLNALGISREQLIDIGILVGTDFNYGIKGVGPKTALRLIREFGNLEAVMDAKGYDIPYYLEIRELFMKPEVTDNYEINWGIVDDVEIKRFLCGKFDFSETGVEKAINKFKLFREATAQKSLDLWG